MAKRNVNLLPSFLLSLIFLSFFVWLASCVSHFVSRRQVKNYCLAFPCFGANVENTFYQSRTALNVILNNSEENTDKCSKKGAEGEKSGELIAKRTRMKRKPCSLQTEPSSLYFPVFFPHKRKCFAERSFQNKISLQSGLCLVDFHFPSKTQIRQ